MQPKNKAAKYWIAAAFLVGFLAVGPPYWKLSYHEITLPTSLSTVGLFVVGLAAATARALGKTRLLRTIFLVGAAVPAVVIVRVVLDTRLDPTTHNLWPFELVIAAFAGGFYSLAGAFAGSLPSYFARKTPPRPIVA